MGNQEETIYQLIPAEVKPPERPPRYISQHRSQVVVESNRNKEPAASMGPAQVPLTAPEDYLKMHSIKSRIAPGEKPSLITKSKIAKPALPGPDEKPVMGLKSEKNYVYENAIENIRGVPSKLENSAIDYRNKKDYGNVPKYMQRRKAEERKERNAAEEMIRQQAQVGNLRLLPDDERERLTDGLKYNWERINKEYQTLSLSVDSAPKKIRKERHETKLRQIEADIEKLSRPHVFVECSGGVV